MYNESIATSSPEINSFLTSPSIRTVLSYLKRFKGICCPRQSTIAKTLGISLRSVERAIKWLVEQGYILKKRVWKLNYYTVITPPIAGEMAGDYIELKHTKKKKDSPPVDNFDETVEAVEICTQHTLDLKTERDKFIAHHKKKQSYYPSWPKAFIGWLQNKLKMKPKSPGGKKMNKYDTPPTLPIRTTYEPLPADFKKATVKTHLESRIQRAKIFKNPTQFRELQEEYFNLCQEYFPLEYS